MAKRKGRSGRRAGVTQEEEAHRANPDLFSLQLHPEATLLI